MYLEAFGATRTALLELQKKRESAYKKIKAFCKKYGAKDFALNQTHYVELYLILENPDLKVWKQDKRDRRYCQPRLGCKAGKEIDKEMRAICAEMPSGSCIAKIIKMQVLGAGGGGLVWRTPGMVTKKNRVLLKVPEDYKIPVALTKDLRRISDIEYEAFAK